MYVFSSPAEMISIVTPMMPERAKERECKSEREGGGSLSYAGELLQ